MGAFNTPVTHTHTHTQTHTNAHVHFLSYFTSHYFIVIHPLHQAFVLITKQPKESREEEHTSELQSR